MMTYKITKKKHRSSHRSRNNRCLFKHSFNHAVTLLHNKDLNQNRRKIIPLPNKK